jgi:hypothetical protein
MAKKHLSLVTPPETRLARFFTLMGDWKDGADVHLGLGLTPKHLYGKRIVLGAHLKHRGKEIFFSYITHKKLDKGEMFYQIYPPAALVQYIPVKCTKADVCKFLQDTPTLTPLYNQWAKKGFT